MGYVVDLTLILQAMFQVSLQDQYEGIVTADHVDEIIYEFHCSERKKNIHDSIRAFAQHMVAEDDVVEKIQFLLNENQVRSSSRQQPVANCRLTPVPQMTLTDTQLNKERPLLRSLISILRLMVWTFGASSHCRS